MKGLFIKDFEIIGSNRRFLLTYLLIILLLGVFNPSFALIYIFIVTASFASRTINYDERNHGLLYLFSWPVTPREYVIEKLIFTLGISLTAGLLLSLIFLFLEVLPFEELLISLLSGWISTVIYLSVYLPVEFKYGAEKSGVVFILIFALLAGAIFLISSTPAAQSLFALFNTVSQSVFLAGLILITLLAAAISASISITILKKKEW